MQTTAQLKEKRATLLPQREQLVGQLNAINGAIEWNDLLIKESEAEDVKNACGQGEFPPLEIVTPEDALATEAAANLLANVKAEVEAKRENVVANCTVIPKDTL